MKCPVHGCKKLLKNNAASLRSHLVRAHGRWALASHLDAIASRD